MTQSLQTTVVQNGFGLGTVIAVVASWHRNQSIVWAILHGICSWAYVVYFALTRPSAKAVTGAVRLSPALWFIVLAVLALMLFFVIAQFVKQ